MYSEVSNKLRIFLPYSFWENFPCIKSFKSRVDLLFLNPRSFMITYSSFRCSPVVISSVVWGWPLDNIANVSKMENFVSLKLQMIGIPWKENINWQSPFSIFNRCCVLKPCLVLTRKKADSVFFCLHFLSYQICMPKTGL